MITLPVLKKGLIAAIRSVIPTAKVYAEKIPQGGWSEPFFHLAFDMAADASGDYHEKRYVTVTLRYFPVHTDEVNIIEQAWGVFYLLNKKVFGSTIEFRSPADNPFPVVAESAESIFRRNRHGLLNGTKGRFTWTVLPEGLLADTDYWVVNATENTFQVATSKGGEPVSFTTDVEDVVFLTDTVRRLSLWRRRAEVVDDVLVFRFEIEFEELLDTADMGTLFDTMEWLKMNTSDPNAGTFTIVAGQ